MSFPATCWFAGSGVFGSLCLERIASTISPELVITQPARRAGRGMKFRETPVASTALDLRADIWRTADINKDEDLLVRFATFPPELLVVVDFSQFVKEPFLSTKPTGCINIHPSLLPEYRGSAPVQRAIMNGEKTTGVTIFQLTADMDAGPVLVRESLEIPSRATAGEMTALLAETGSRILIDGLKLFYEGRISFSEQQHEQASFAPRIDKQEAHLSWENPSRKVHDLVRAMNPSPGGYVLFQGKRIKIWRTETRETGSMAYGSGTFAGVDDQGDPMISCAVGLLVLREVQPEGRSRMDGSAWIRGSGLKKGDGFC